MPFGKESYESAETLGYLTSTQALADYAVLIRSLKQNLSAEASPVVVFGGSYGGSKFFSDHIIMCSSFKFHRNTNNRIYRVENFGSHNNINLKKNIINLFFFFSLLV